MLTRFCTKCRHVLRGVDVRTVTEESLKRTLQPLLEITSKLSLEDLGLDVARLNTARDSVGYLSVLDEPNFQVGIFIIPPGGYIPLHDHPGMTVITRVLGGRLTRTALDWEGEAASIQGSLYGGPAKVKKINVLESPAVEVLYPRSHNIHHFKADEETGCAFLDIITPLYDDNHRPCTYYELQTEDGQSSSIESLSKNQVMYLSPGDTPDDFEVAPFPFTLPTTS